MPRGGQLFRQWRLLHLIERHHGVTVEDAARDLDCAVRTIWRDLDALQKAGFERLRDDMRWPSRVPPTEKANFAWVIVHHMAASGSSTPRTTRRFGVI